MKKPSSCETGRHRPGLDHESCVQCWRSWPCPSATEVDELRFELERLKERVSELEGIQLDSVLRPEGPCERDHCNISSALHGC